MKRVEFYKTEFEDFMEDYTNEQIFNENETRLNYKMLLQKFFAEQSTLGQKMNQPRTTV